jgi:hypothetical protein
MRRVVGKLILVVAIPLAGFGAPVSAQDAAAPLDLAAMTLTPADLNEPGFQIGDGRTQTLEDRISAQVAEGADPADVRAFLEDVGWERGYRARLGRPTTPDGDVLDALVVSSVVEFATERGARVGFPRTPAGAAAVRMRPPSRGRGRSAMNRRWSGRRIRRSMG